LTRRFLIIGLLLVFTCSLSAQEVVKEDYSPSVVLKTNLLYDATTTLNLGAEFRLNNKFTFDLPFNYNPWTFSDNKKLKHWLVQPEFRYWLHESFNGSFWGLHALGGQLNTANIIDNYQYEGWFAGAGISYGYRWNLSKRWGLEATIGAGFVHLDYDKYECQTCGQKIAQETKNLWMPTKVGLSLTYTLGQTAKKSVETIRIIEPVIQIRTDTVFISSKKEKIHYKHESGEAVILFPIDQSVLLPYWKQNPAELAKIQHSLDTVRAIPNVRIDHIFIEAYASPEGDLQHNIHLSEQRAAALKDYMAATYGLDEKCFTVRSKGENWKGLRDAISTSILTKKEQQEVLKILDIQDLATRKSLLKKYGDGRVYSYLLREIYPQLRISEYRIEYTLIEKNINNNNN
jgi:outer membrane protein OmpA-like peptidoglycan-associated protein